MKYRQALWQAMLDGKFPWRYYKREGKTIIRLLWIASALIVAGMFAAVGNAWVGGTLVGLGYVVGAVAFHLEARVRVKRSRTHICELDDR